MGWIGVETNEGAVMLSQLAGGSHTLTITGVTVGSGYVADVNMRTATALQSSKMSGAIAEKVNITGGIKLRLRVLAATAQVGAFTMHEIGVWGHLDNGTDKLIILCQDSVTGVDVPTQAQSSEFVFDLIVPLVISNTTGLTVTISSSVFITHSDMVSYVSQEIGNTIDDTAGDGDTDKVWSANKVFDELATKADKDADAVQGNFAAFDASGNPVDSGKKASDFIDASTKGAANGVAELDASGKVPSGQLPSYVDDVIEGYYYNSKFWKESAHTTEITGETGKIYVDLSTEKCYRWSGSLYIEISSYAEATQSASGLMSASDKTKLDGVQSGATKASSVTATLAAANWAGNDAPYTQTITVQGMTSSNDASVGFGGSLTTSQQEAMAAAQIVPTAQGTNSITLSAFGEKPEIDLPVVIIIHN